jgi:hypothetical protein
MRIDSSPQSDPRISDQSNLLTDEMSAPPTDSKTESDTTGDILETQLDPSTYEQATQDTSNTAAPTGESSDDSIDGVSLQEIQRRENLFATQLADGKLAAGGDLEAYKRLVQSETGKPPTRQQIETFELGGGLPLLGVERQSQLLNDPITSKEYSDRWQKASADYNKGLGGDLDAWKRFNAAMNGRQIDFAEEIQFEDGGGPNVLANERQMQLLGIDPPKEHLDRMAKLQATVEKAINGDSKAQSQVESAFGMTPGALSGNTLKDPGVAGMIRGLAVPYQPEVPQPGSSATSQSNPTTASDGWAGLHAWAGDAGAGESSSPTASSGASGAPGSDPSEWSPFPGSSSTPSSSSTEEAASDPSEWAPFPGDSSAADGSRAPVGINATDVHEDGSVQILLTDGTAKNFSSVGEAMEWEKSAGVGLYAPAGNSSGAAVGSETTTGSGTATGSATTTTTETTTETDNSTDETDATEEEAVEENDDEDAYINPDADRSTSTELSAAGKLKLDGGGITDGRPELINDSPLEFDPNAADPYRFVRDLSPEGDPTLATGTLNLNSKVNPETRPELQSDAPDAPDGSDINPYAGKG